MVIREARKKLSNHIILVKHWMLKRWQTNLDKLNLKTSLKWQLLNLKVETYTSNVDNLQWPYQRLDIHSFFITISFISFITFRTTFVANKKLFVYSDHFCINKAYRSKVYQATLLKALQPNLMLLLAQSLHFVCPLVCKWWNIFSLIKLVITWWIL